MFLGYKPAVSGVFPKIWRGDKNLVRTGKKLHHLSRIAEPSKHRLVEVIDIVTFDYGKGGELEWIHASVIQ